MFFFSKENKRWKAAIEEADCFFFFCFFVLGRCAKTVLYRKAVFSGGCPVARACADYRKICPPCGSSYTRSEARGKCSKRRSKGELSNVCIENFPSGTHLPWYRSFENSQNSFKLVASCRGRFCALGACSAYKNREFGMGSFFKFLVRALKNMDLHHMLG